MNNVRIEHIASTQTTESAAGRPFIVDWHWGEDEDGFHLLGCSFEPLSLDGESMPQMHLELSDGATADNCDWVVSKRGKGYALYFCGVGIVSYDSGERELDGILYQGKLPPSSDFQPCDEPAEAYVADLRSSGKVAG